MVTRLPHRSPDVDSTPRRVVPPVAPPITVETVLGPLYVHELERFIADTIDQENTVHRRGGSDRELGAWRVLRRAAHAAMLRRLDNVTVIEVGK